MRCLTIVLLISFLLLVPSARAEEQPSPAPAPPAVPAELLTSEEALHHVGSADPTEREQGLYQLGMLKSKEHVVRVTEALNDGHPDVRRSAVVALRLILGADAVPQLEALAKTSRRRELREQALHELEALQLP